MNTLNIRPLAAEDLIAAKAVVDSTGLFPGEMLHDMTAAYLGADSGDELWFVASRNDAVIGLVYCAPERLTDRTWNLLLIAVLDTEQGKGVGSRLTAHLETALSNRRERLLLVETSALPEFDRTRAVYRKLGYVEVARIPAFYAAGEDKVVFWKMLTG
ncbi:GNAT family N-acetyltransferase [Brevundimonas sp.]|uniref:GNAT family N-acetyltransferase n=1 Tax=Brevundimonas sp. TaxID=1871086 RepID=UPI002E104789|nr:GNAT family N-acetyltransferase [Brevundimonas sp.]